MARLSASELRSRLAFDFRVMMAMRSPTLAITRAYADHHSVRWGRDVTPDEGEAGRARVYVVRFAFPHLIEPGRVASSFDVQLDLCAGGEYPHSAPLVTVLSRPLPYCDHIDRGGVFCAGHGWRGSKTLAAQLVIHIARVVNFDQPTANFSHRGYLPEATIYWRDVLCGRPAFSVDYPTLPVHLTHAGAVGEPTFRPIGAAARGGLFR